LKKISSEKNTKNKSTKEKINVQLKLKELGFQDWQTFDKKLSIEDWQIVFDDLKFNIKNSEKSINPISNAGGWLREAVNKNPTGQSYKPSSDYKNFIDTQEKKEKRVLQEKKEIVQNELIKKLITQYEKYQQELYENLINKISKHEKEAVIKEFEEKIISKKTNIVKDIYKRKGLESIIFKNEFTHLLFDIFGIQNIDFIEYAKQQGYKIKSKDGDYVLV